jgi:hypothetical protein
LFAEEVLTGRTRPADKHYVIDYEVIEVNQPQF